MHNGFVHTAFPCHSTVFALLFPDTSLSLRCLSLCSHCVFSLPSLESSLPRLITAFALPLHCLCTAFRFVHATGGHDSPAAQR